VYVFHYCESCDSGRGDVGDDGSLHRFQMFLQRDCFICIFSRSQRLQDVSRTCSEMQAHVRVLRSYYLRTLGLFVFFIISKKELRRQSSDNIKIGFCPVRVFLITRFFSLPAHNMPIRRHVGSLTFFLQNVMS